MPKIDRRSLVLLVLGVEEDGSVGDGLGGITRLQKLLYLLEQEGHITPSDDAFEFAAYKAGPYSSKLYDDLEFLENIGLIQSASTGEATEEEAKEVDMLDFDELISETPHVTGPKADDGHLAADAYEERSFKITRDGRDKIKRLMESGQYEPLVDGVRKIKRKYGGYSLNELLYYVYTKYPNMTTESEIKDKVLRWGR